jgi:hypothetical protein
MDVRRASRLPNISLCKRRLLVASSIGQYETGKLGKTPLYDFTGFPS